MHSFSASEQARQIAFQAVQCKSEVEENMSKVSTSLTLSPEKSIRQYPVPK